MPLPLAIRCGRDRVSQFAQRQQQQQQQQKNINTNRTTILSHPPMKFGNIKHHNDEHSQHNELKLFRMVF